MIYGIILSICGFYSFFSDFNGNFLLFIGLLFFCVYFYLKNNSNKNKEEHKKEVKNNKQEEKVVTTVNTKNENSSQCAKIRVSQTYCNYMKKTDLEYWKEQREYLIRNLNNPRYNTVNLSFLTEIERINEYFEDTVEYVYNKEKNFYYWYGNHYDMAGGSASRSGPQNTISKAELIEKIKEEKENCIRYIALEQKEEFLKIFTNILGILPQFEPNDASEVIGISTDNIKCSCCNSSINESQVKRLDGKILCAKCYNMQLNSDDAPSDEMTFITSIGSGYSGGYIYYDHSSKQLFEHTYAWHIDDWQEFIAWHSISLESVLQKIISYKNVSVNDKEVNLLSSFFGSEVNAIIEKISSSISKTN